MKKKYLFILKTECLWIETLTKQRIGEHANAPLSGISYLQYENKLNINPVRDKSKHNLQIYENKISIH